MRADPREDVREPPVLHRQAAGDGRRDHDLRPAPRDRHRTPPASRPASRLARHPCRNGHADRGAVRRGQDRDWQRSPHRPWLRAYRRAAARSGRTDPAPGRRARPRVTSGKGLPLFDRIPSGTRDVLPDEMRELRALTDRVREVFERAGYGEVYTPALEYELPLARPQDHPEWTGPRPAYRVFDEQGNVLALRSDMTIPIARLAATRYRQADSPLRFCYFAHAYRGVRPQRGQSRELLQAGIELIGAGTPEGTAEVLTVLCDALDATGLRTYRVGLGAASLLPGLLEAAGVDTDTRERILGELVAGDFVGVERALDALELAPGQRSLLL